MKTKQKPSSYSPEFRKNAVKLAIEADQPRSVTARELGINVNTLHTWVSKHQEISGSVTQNSQLTEGEEVQSLRKEIKRLREERDILKKASGWAPPRSLRSTKSCEVRIHSVSGHKPCRDSALPGSQNLPKRLL